MKCKHMYGIFDFTYLWDWRLYIYIYIYIYTHYITPHDALYINIYILEELLKLSSKDLIFQFRVHPIFRSNWNYKAMKKILEAFFYRWPK
jgi:hypothetical protein